MVPFQATYLITEHQLAAFQTSIAPIAGIHQRLELFPPLLLAFCCQILTTITTTTSSSSSHTAFPLLPTLHSQPQKAAAILGAAETFRLFVAFTLELIIKRQLGSGFHVLFSEDADARGVIDAPLLRLAVRIAGVVDKSALIAFRPRVDDRFGIDGHHVEISLVIIAMSVQSSLRLFVVDQFTHIFGYESSSFDVFVQSQSPPSIVGRFKHGQFRISQFLESLILAFLTGGASGRMTFALQETIETFIVDAGFLIGFALADGDVSDHRTIRGRRR